MTRFATLILVAALGAPLVANAQSPDLSVVGRWDVVVRRDGRDTPAWFEIRKSGNGTLVGEYVGQVGSARPVSRFTFASGELRFAVPPQWERIDQDIAYTGRMEGDSLRGEMTEGSGARFTWTAHRAPALRRAAAPVWGAPIRLFDGKTLAGWRPDADSSRWRAVDGVLQNTRGGGANLRTERTFGDFKLHIEFRYPKGGNSGVYLRGRHEVQISDAAPISGLEQLGAVYGFLAPNPPAPAQPGVWQTYDITLVGRTLTVVHNGKRIICEREIPGITGGAIDSNEGAPGPILLQGDHTAVEYRNIVLTPAK